MSTNVVATTPIPFDVSAMLEHLYNTDHLALVIRAHLYVEAVLICHIETIVAKKEQFDSVSLPFLTKVKLAVAIGKVDSADVGALKVLNSLRNRFAHKLDTRLEEQDENDLYNALSKLQRTIVDQWRNPQTDYIERLRFDLVGLIVAVYDGPAGLRGPEQSAATQ